MLRYLFGQLIQIDNTVLLDNKNINKGINILSIFYVKKPQKPNDKIKIKQKQNSPVKLRQSLKFKLEKRGIAIYMYMDM